MSQSKSQTIEQVLFEQMGVTVEQALATGTDIVDEKMAAAAEAGVDVPRRLENLFGLFERLSRPETADAVSRLIDGLPDLAALVEKSSGLSDAVAMMVDVMDDHQQRYSQNGIDVERSLSQGLRAALWLGSHIRNEDLSRIGDLLNSNILDARAVRVVDAAAKSLAEAGDQDPAANRRIGLLGLLAVLRKPEIQSSLAFGIRFARSFGNHLEQDRKR